MHKTTELSAGTIRYRDRGEGPVVLFVHGVFVDSRLWDTTAELLLPNHRVIQPDFPLGAHQLAMHADADLSPPALGRLVLEFMGALDLRDVTIVGNDTGGAITQMAVTTDASRVGHMVLTTCDAFDVFPPRQFAYFKLVGRVPALTWLVGRALQFPVLRNRRFAFGGLSKRGIPEDLMTDWVAPLRLDREVRRDARKIMRTASTKQTMAAGLALADFDPPATIVWGRDDPYFPSRLAERLQATLPDARLVWLDDTSTFVPLDQPERLAALIAEALHAA